MQQRLSVITLGAAGCEWTPTPSGKARAERPRRNGADMVIAAAGIGLFTIVVILLIIVAVLLVVRRGRV